ncbi:TetR/AcrR family transcriptional regulator [Leadbetterella sp. DM7]|uniref:TetR/AcrR family transcriptional regulator n=1 Tax=Leadbetterella sp. DM7 TaxID=3235085 RepID=UPI00349E56F1
MMQKPKKERKPAQGPVRDKARTYENMIESVGVVLKEKGHKKLNGANIARQAKVNTGMIYLYFQSIDSLIEAYIKRIDFWTPESNAHIQEILANPRRRGAEDFHTLLINQLNSVHSNRDLQQVLLWELSEQNEILSKISREREELGELLFQFVEDDFKDSGLDIRAILAIMISGIYYSSIHATNNGSTFCSIDMNKREGKQRFENALKQIINLCYDKIAS